jgi:putative ABC transport system permease protein
MGAIYIACSGLFAIATFFIKRRTKEIGIRKVMGASVAQITWLVSAEFLFIVLLANLIAWPLAWYGMDSWLSGFAYRIPIGAGSFLIAGALAVLMATMTISFQAIKSAFANPVDSLRNE